MTTADGFTRSIAETGAVFAVFLIPHILAGLTAVASGAVVMLSRKGTHRHVRAGTIYFWAIAGLAVTAAGLTSVRGSRDLYLLLLGALALALASAGRLARRRPGHAPHILGMTCSYTVMLTAFYVDNAKILPLADRLPTTVFWILPAAVATPLIAGSLWRHRKRSPAEAPARPPPAGGRAHPVRRPS